MSKKRRNIRLRQSFVLYVFITFLLVVSVSAVVIFGCMKIQKWILPESDEVFLNIEQTAEDGSTSLIKERIKIGDNTDILPKMQTSETSTEKIVNARYSIISIENSFTSLSPKRQILYRGSSIAMVALPAIFSVLGILFCGFSFYKKKLKVPIELLTDAADKIAAQDLDFAIPYDASDELGALCVSFEQMRKALWQNNQRLWEMIEERKQLQTSVAHDLRNPIAIIEGHAEYLRINLPEGKLDEKTILGIAGNIEKAAKRLEKYTDSIRALNHLEELEVSRRRVDFTELSQEIANDLEILVKPYPVALICKNNVTEQYINLDPQVFYRILENLVSNAARFAKSKIEVTFASSEGTLSVTVLDDGCGFSDKILKAKYGCMPVDCTNGEHFGMGLMICRILVKKHGGSLNMYNGEAGGAVIKIKLTI